MRFPSFLRGTASRGFSLAELLVVVAIMGLLATISTPGLVRSYRASTLTASGNRAVDLAMQARQNALSRNAMTALVLAINGASPNQAMTVIELQADQTWKQISSWAFLSPNAKAYPNGGASTTLPGTAPTLVLNGKSLGAGGYACYVFNPDGTTYNSAAVLPQLYVQYASDTAPSGGGGNTGLPNYYDLVFSDAGGIHIVRP